MRSAVAAPTPAIERATQPAAIVSLAMAVPDRVVTNATVAERAGVDRAVDRPPHRRARAPPRVGRRAPAGPRHRRRPAGARAGRTAAPATSTWCWSRRSGPTSCCPTPLRWWRTDLGADRAGAMDVGAACTGFLSALSLAAAQVESGRCEHVLVIGADVLSRFTDQSDRGTAALFADGAGAVVVGPADGGPGLIGHIALHADGVRWRGDPRHPRGRDHPHAGPRHLQGGRAPAVRVDRRGGRPRGPRARRHRPVRLPPGQRPHPRRRRRAPRRRRATA